MAQYTVKFHPDVVRFFRSLSPESQKAIRNLVVLITLAPGDGKPVRTAAGVLYQKTLDTPRDEFPAGLRVMYHIFQQELIIAVIDCGDHTRSARHPEASIYQDERIPERRIA